jgi:hypothetical protein
LFASNDCHYDTPSTPAHMGRLPLVFISAPDIALQLQLMTFVFAPEAALTLIQHKTLHCVMLIIKDIFPKGSLIPFMHP